MKLFMLKQDYNKIFLQNIKIDISLNFPIFKQNFFFFFLFNHFKINVSYCKIAELIKEPVTLLLKYLVKNILTENLTEIIAEYSNNFNLIFTQDYQFFTNKKTSQKQPYEVPTSTVFFTKIIEIFYYVPFTSPLS